NKAKKLRGPPQKESDDKVELKIISVVEPPTVIPEAKKFEDLPPVEIPSKPEPSKIKIYELPEQENLKIVNEPKEIDLGSFKTVSTKTNEKTSNYEEIPSVEELKKNYINITVDRFEWKAFKN